MTKSSKSQSASSPKARRPKQAGNKANVKLRIRIMRLERRVDDLEALLHQAEVAQELAYDALDDRLPKGVSAMRHLSVNKRAEQ